ncbi:MAG: hypothetical protein HXL97_06595 [[Eubacterium] sulci]|nr:hypothetical protein [[Eubacterium] sulci]
MNNFEKYKILSAGKPFAHRAKIAMVMLDSATVYEELKEEASKTSVPSGYRYIGGFPENILEMLVNELICRETWYLPDEAKIWDRRFGSLFVNKFFCYDDDAEIWSKVLHRYFLELEWMPKKEDYSSTRSYNKAWEYFGELLAVVKQNNHPEFEKYFEIAKENGMNEVVLERKLNELSEIKKSFELASK